MPNQKALQMLPAYKYYMPPGPDFGPFVYSSPHSGRCYPASFKKASRLCALDLRRSEDCYVDELFASVPDHGAPLIAATYPRAYIDLNRDVMELDPLLFRDPLPVEAKTTTERVTAGLGTIPRVVAIGVPIYSNSLPLVEAENRISRIYHPYHAALARLLKQAHVQNGWSVLIDCHSMPSGPLQQDVKARDIQAQAATNSYADFVLGDRHGASCDPRLTVCAEEALSKMGYKVSRNVPYAGGYCTDHYSNRHEGRHALQIEINRALYINEHTLTKKSSFRALVKDINRLVAALSRIDLSSSQPMAAE